MKEWSNKPSSLVQTSSSPVKTVSSSPVGSAGSSIVKTSGSIVKTSGSIVKTSGSPVTLTSGSSTTSIPSSSYTAGTSMTQRVAAGTAMAAPLSAGVMVGGISAVFYGVSNMVKYAKSQKTGAQAAKDTVKGSAGLGVAAGLGVTAAHAVAGTTLALGSTFLVPITAGVATGYISAKIWNKIFFKKPDTSKIKAKAKSEEKQASSG
jgi:hypothetical protein